jgi:transposase
MGVKERAFGPLPPVSLEDLIPSDHFSRHLERTLDLSFVRELVRGTYAEIGRPSIDPVVFFKMQLILFFEGLRSERQLMRVVADRLSLRWYLGYDLTEPLPDHSSLTRLRERYGLDVFRRFFEAIVEQCIAAGLVWGKELSFDATKVAANASLDSITPRFAVEAHLADLFAEAEAGGGGGGGGGGEDGGDGGDNAGADDPPAPAPLPVALTEAAQAELAVAAAARHDWIGGAGRPDRGTVRGHDRRTADYRVSTTDPDASPMWQTSGRTHLGFHDHDVVDGGKARIVLAALVTPAEVMENQPMPDLLWRTCFRWKLRPRQVTGDTTYATLENIVAVEDEGIRADVPLPSGPHPPGIFRRDAFAYDPDADVYRCPGDQVLTFRNVKAGERVRVYQAEAATCQGCALRSRCTTGSSSRRIHRNYDEAYLERVRDYHATPADQKAIRKRQVWVEPLFAEAKEWHGLRRFRLRGLEKVNAEALLIAAGQNLKRLLSRWGWGCRPWPSGAAGVVLPAAQPVVVSPG